MLKSKPHGDVVQKCGPSEPSEAAAHCKITLDHPWHPGRGNPEGEKGKKIKQERERKRKKEEGKGRMEKEDRSFLSNAALLKTVAVMSLQTLSQKEADNYFPEQQKQNQNKPQPKQHTQHTKPGSGCGKRDVKRVVKTT